MFRAGTIFVVLLITSANGFSQKWEKLTDEFFELMNKGEYSKAISVGEGAVIAAKKEFGETNKKYTTSLANLALVYKILNQYKKAEPLYIRAMEILKKTSGEADPDYAESLSDLGRLYRKTLKYQQAEDFFSRAKEIRATALKRAHPGYVSSLYDLALVYVDMDLYEKAESLLLEGIKIWKDSSGEEHPSYAECVSRLADLYSKMGKFEKAEFFSIQAKDTRRKVLGANHPNYAISLNNLALLYFNMGLYEKAEPLYIEATDILKQQLGENSPDYATCLNNLGRLYKNMYQYEKAERFYMQAKEILQATRGTNEPAYAISLNNLASLYMAMDDYDKAEIFFIESKDIREKRSGEDPRGYATILNNLAGLYKDRGQYEKAETLYIKATDLWKTIVGDSHPDYATGLKNLAVLYSKMGRYEKAEALIIQAKDIFKKTVGENHPDYAASLSSLAAIYYSYMGKYEKAEPVLLEYSKIFQKKMLTTFSILSENEKGKYLHNISIIETNNSFLYNYPTAASSIVKNNFNLQLFLKSLSLAEINNMLKSVRSNKDSTIRKLFDTWLSNKKILSKQYSLMANKRIPDLKKIEARTESVEKELTRRSSEFRDQQAALRISMQDVQKNLQKDEAAIEFVRFNLYNKKWTDSVMYAAYILGRDDSVPHFVPLFEEQQLQQLCDSYGRTATSLATVFYAAIDTSRKTETPGEKLYKLVWQPLEPYLKNVKKIAYSPAGKLYDISFNALPAGDGELLIDKYLLQQYVSTRQIALRTGADQTVRPGSIVLFGNAKYTMDSLELVKQKKTGSSSLYLPEDKGDRSEPWHDLKGTAEELKKIGELFEQNRISTKTFAQAEASEENMKALSGNSPNILHIGTHGFFLPPIAEQYRNNDNAYNWADDPLLRSGMILAGGNYAWIGKTPVDGVEDGVVTAYEISQLNFSNTELVTLSACESALGDIKGSEGVFGLQRAFKIAGVKKIIASLWKVPDTQTAELIISFYSNWMNGKTISESFYQAQSEMRKKYSPYYWAAFVLVE